MEYTLLTIFYFFQSLFNMFITLQVADGVTVGGILIAIMIFGLLFSAFGFLKGRMNNKGE